MLALRAAKHKNYLFILLSFANSINQSAHISPGINCQKYLTLLGSVHQSLSHKLR